MSQAPAPKKKKRPSVLAKLSLAIASTLVTIVALLILAEVGLRVVGFKYQLFPEKIEFGYPDPALFESLYLSDPDLFWVRDIYHEQLDNSQNIDIVFMGDSCTEFGKYDEFLAELVSQRHPGKGFSYLNTGCGGWTSWQGRRQFERDILPLKPKVVTFYYGWNDHWIGFGIEDNMVARMNNSTLYNFRNLRLVQYLIGSYIQKKNEDGVLKRVAPEDFRDNLTTMVQLAKENGITPVIFTAASSHRVGREPGHLANRWLPNISDIVPLHQEYVSIAREVAADQEVLLCDLAKDFDALPTTTLTREYFKMDGIHFVPTGDRKMSEFIYTCFDSSGILNQIIHEGTEFRRYPGRTFPGEVNPPVKQPGDPSLPLLFNLDKVGYNSDGYFSIDGWVLSPSPVDYVVVYLGETNLGIAVFPIQSPDITEKHPEYHDDFARFAFFRDFDDEALKSVGTKGKIEFYSGDKLLETVEFTRPEKEKQ